MIIYNVTVNVNESIHDEWIIWIRETHIPEVLATGKFNDYRMFKVLSRQADETGHTYSIQYTANDMATYDDYRLNFAPGMQKKTYEKFGDNFIAFRTLLETVE